MNNCEALIAAAEECASELEGRVEHDYAEIKHHPAMKHRYERDIEPVIVLRQEIELFKMRRAQAK